MNPPFFNSQMARLRAVPGWKEAYNKDRQSAFWIWAKNIHDKQFETMVTALIGESSFPPMLDKFKEYYAEHFANNPDKVVSSDWASRQPWCEKCGRSGSIIGTNEESPTLGFAFRCNCVCGSRLCPNFPLWQESTKFKRISFGWSPPVYFNPNKPIEMKTKGVE